MISASAEGNGQGHRDGYCSEDRNDLFHGYFLRVGYLMVERVDREACGPPHDRCL